MNEETINTKQQVVKVIKDYLNSSAFTARKLTDTPVDRNQVVPRGYVTMNGPTVNRPTSSVIGQRYFDTNLNKPVWVGNGFAWVDSSGNPA